MGFWDEDSSILSGSKSNFDDFSSYDNDDDYSIDSRCMIGDLIKKEGKNEDENIFEEKVRCRGIPPEVAIVSASSSGSSSTSSSDTLECAPISQRGVDDSIPRRIKEDDNDDDSEQISKVSQCRPAVCSYKKRDIKDLSSSTKQEDEGIDRVDASTRKDSGQKGTSLETKKDSNEKVSPKKKKSGKKKKKKSDSSPTSKQSTRKHTKIKQAESSPSAIPTATSKKQSLEEVNEERWNAMFLQLQEYKEKYENCLVPYNFSENKSLGYWVSTQRKKIKSNKLSVSRQKRLDSIGFIWDVNLHRRNKDQDDGDDDSKGSISQDTNEDTKKASSIASLGHVKKIPIMKEEGHCPPALSDNEEEGSDHVDAKTRTSNQPKQTSSVLSLHQETVRQQKKEKKKKSRSKKNKSISSPASKKKTKKDTTAKKDKSSPSAPSNTASSTKKNFEQVYEEKWNTMFRQLKEYKEKHGHCFVPKKCKENKSLGIWVANHRQRMKRQKVSESRQHRLDSIGFTWDIQLCNPRNARSKESNEKRWNAMFLRLQEYKQKYGDCRVPVRFIGDKSLGNWVLKQRCSRRKNELSAFRQHRLDSIGFTWENMRGMHRTKVKDEESNCNLGRSYPIENDSENESYHGDEEHRGSTDNDGTSLIQEEDEAFTCNSKEEPIAYYDEKFPETRKRNRIPWEEMFKELQKYKEEHGDCFVPCNYPGDKALGYWVAKQRKQMKSKKLSVHRRYLLDSIGFIWDAHRENIKRTYPTKNQIQYEQAWNKMFQRYLNHKQTCSNCFGTEFCTNNDKKLYRWIRKQRANLKSKDLSSSRHELLDSVGFVWSVKKESRKGSLNERYEQRWNENFQQLVLYKEKHGNCLVPRQFTENKSLGNWVQRQRHFMKSKRMSLHRKHRLDSIGFVWEVTEHTSIRRKNGTKLKDKDDSYIVAGCYAEDNTSLSEQTSDFDNEVDSDYEDDANCDVYSSDSGTTSDSDNRNHRVNKGSYNGNRHSDEFEIDGSNNIEDIIDDKSDKNYVESGDDPSSPLFTDSDSNSNSGEVDSINVPDSESESSAEYEIKSSNRTKTKFKGVGDNKDVSCSEDENESENESCLNDECDCDSEEWNAMFKRLLKYKRKNGNCHVPPGYKDDRPLAKWVKNQRLLWREHVERKIFHASKEPSKNQSTAFGNENFRRLTSIGFVWKLEEEGSHDDECGSDVGSIDNKEIDDCKRNKKKESRGDKVKSPKLLKKNRWDKMFEVLCKYKKKHGHCRVPSQYAKDVKLASWVQSRRREMKILRKKYDASIASSVPPSLTPVKDEQITAEGGVSYSSSGVVTVPGIGSLFPSNHLNFDRITRLASIGFQWVEHSAKWDELFERLRAYKNEHGNFRFSNVHDRKLARWVGRQRAEMRKLRREFDASHGSYTTPSTNTTQQDGTEENGVLCSPSGVVTIRGLGSLIPSSKLSLHRIKCLVSIDFPWIPEKRQTANQNKKSFKEHEWDGMFERLCYYKFEHGDCHVPQRYEEDPQLGMWVSRQRADMVSLLRSCRMISRRRNKAEAQIESVVAHVTSLGVSIGKFSAERLARLKMIEFAWRAQKTRKSVGRDTSSVRNGTLSTALAGVSGMVASTESGDISVANNNSSRTASTPFESSSSFASSSNNNNTKRSQSRKRQRDEHESGVTVSHSPERKSLASLPPPLRRWRKKMKIETTAAKSPSHRPESDTATPTHNQAGNDGWTETIISAPFPASV